MRFLGVDMGGSSTHAHLIDSEGGRSLELPGGNVALDPEAAQRILLDLFDHVGPTTACLGIAGARTATGAAEDIAARLRAGGAKVHLVSDAALAAMTALGPTADGIVLCAGTGTVALTRISGDTTLIGGHGYLLDDRGGAYDIGRQLLAMALRDLDAGRPALADNLESAIGEPLLTRVARIYANPADRSHVANLAPLVESLDSTIASIIHRRAASSLVSLADTARDRFGRLPVFIMGGVFQSVAIREHVSAACDATWVVDRPEVVAAQMARAAA